MKKERRRVMPKVLCIKNIEIAKEQLKKLKVSTRGIDIMSPKAIHRIIKVSGIDSRAANIIKQEMLSRGGEAAAPWELYKMDLKKVDMILMGTLRQYEELCVKLELQPFGLPLLAQDIREALHNYDKKPSVIKAGRFELDLSSKTYVMGILNVTPDSFSDGGKFFDYTLAAEQGRRMALEGADIIDIGGESTRPGADPVSVDEELKRVIPVIEKLSTELDVPISIDTYKPQVAKEALEAGASIVNDVSGLRDDKMIELIAEKNVPVVIMHMKGTPRDMQINPSYDDVVSEVADWLDSQARKAISAGISRDNLLIDPGIGFGKTLEHNVEIIRCLSAFKSLGYPIVLGTSRKSFIGAILDLPVEERLEGTLATLAYGIIQGANIVRVHDVKEAVRVSRVIDAIKEEHA
ncbi:MAG: dihydropteroate synthase [Actinomycetota bacterium]|nr:dihydropteroate synthase [Actinomycetota bacterium]